MKTLLQIEANMRQHERVARTATMNTAALIRDVQGRFSELQVTANEALSYDQKKLGVNIKAVTQASSQVLGLAKYTPVPIASGVLSSAGKAAVLLEKKIFGNMLGAMKKNMSQAERIMNSARLRMLAALSTKQRIIAHKLESSAAQFNLAVNEYRLASGPNQLDKYQALQEAEKSHHQNLSELESFKQHLLTLKNECDNAQEVAATIDKQSPNDGHRKAIKRMSDQHPLTQHMYKAAVIEYMRHRFKKGTGPTYLKTEEVKMLEKAFPERFIENRAVGEESKEFAEFERARFGFRAAYKQSLRDKLRESVTTEVTNTNKTAWFKKSGNALNKKVEKALTKKVDAVYKSQKMEHFVEAKVRDTLRESPFYEGRMVCLETYKRHEKLKRSEKNVNEITDSTLIQISSVNVSNKTKENIADILSEEAVALESDVKYDALFKFDNDVVAPLSSSNNEQIAPESSVLSSAVMQSPAQAIDSRMTQHERLTETAAFNTSASMLDIQGLFSELQVTVNSALAYDQKKLASNIKAVTQVSSQVLGLSKYAPVPLPSTVLSGAGKGAAFMEKKLSGNMLAVMAKNMSQADRAVNSTRLRLLSRLCAKQRILANTLEQSATQYNLAESEYHSASGLDKMDKFFNLQAAEKAHHQNLSALESFKQQVLSLKNDCQQAQEMAATIEGESPKEGHRKALKRMSDQHPLTQHMYKAAVIEYMAHRFKTGTGPTYLKTSEVKMLEKAFPERFIENRVMGEQAKQMAEFNRVRVKFSSAYKKYFRDKLRDSVTTEVTNSNKKEWPWFKKSGNALKQKIEKALTKKVNATVDSLKIQQFIEYQAHQTLQESPAFPGRMVCLETFKRHEKLKRSKKETNEITVDTIIQISSAKVSNKTKECIADILSQEAELLNSDARYDALFNFGNDNTDAYSSQTQEEGQQKAKIEALINVLEQLDSETSLPEAKLALIDAFETKYQAVFNSELQTDLASHNAFQTLMMRKERLLRVSAEANGQSTLEAAVIDAAERSPSVQAIEVEVNQHERIATIDTLNLSASMLDIEGLFHELQVTANTTLSYDKKKLGANIKSATAASTQTGTLSKLGPASVMVAGKGVSILGSKLLGSMFGHVAKNMYQADKSMNQARLQMLSMLNAKQTKIANKLERSATQYNLSVNAYHLASTDKQPDALLSLQAAKASHQQNLSELDAFKQQVLVLKSECQHAQEMAATIESQSPKDGHRKATKRMSDQHPLTQHLYKAAVIEYMAHRFKDGVGPTHLKTAEVKMLEKAFPERFIEKRVMGEENKEFAEFERARFGFRAAYKQSLRDKLRESVTTEVTNTNKTAWFKKSGNALKKKIEKALTKKVDAVYKSQKMEHFVEAKVRNTLQESPVFAGRMVCVETFKRHQKLARSVPETNDIDDGTMIQISSAKISDQTKECIADILQQEKAKLNSKDHLQILLKLSGKQGIRSDSAATPSPNVEAAPVADSDVAAEVAPAADFAVAAEVAPAQDSVVAAEEASDVESIVATEVTPIADSVVAVEVAPAADSAVAVEVTPAADSVVASEAAPAADSAVAVEVAPVVDSVVAVEVAPAADSAVAVEVAPVVDSAIAAEVASVADSTEVAIVASTMDSAADSAVAAPVTDTALAPEPTVPSGEIDNQEQEWRINQKIESINKLSAKVNAKLAKSARQGQFNPVIGIEIERQLRNFSKNIRRILWLSDKSEQIERLTDIEQKALEFNGIMELMHQTDHFACVHGFDEVPLALQPFITSDVENRSIKQQLEADCFRIAAMAAYRLYPSMTESDFMALKENLIEQKRMVRRYADVHVFDNATKNNISEKLSELKDNLAQKIIFFKEGPTCPATSQKIALLSEEVQQLEALKAMVDNKACFTIIQKQLAVISNSVSKVQHIDSAHTLVSSAIIETDNQFHDVANEIQGLLNDHIFENESGGGANEGDMEDDDSSSRELGL